MGANRGDWRSLSGKDRKLAYRREWAKKWREEHPEERNAIVRQQRARRKEKVIKFYGGKCSCPGGCHTTNVRWLGIDHKFGGGKKDRARFKSYMAYYGWLLKKKRKGYRAMCYNCNMSWAIYGECIH